MRWWRVSHTNVKPACITQYFLTAVRRIMIVLTLMEVAQTTMTDGDGAAGRRTDMKRLTGNGIATGLAYYERLRDIEDILGDEYDLDELRKAMAALRREQDGNRI